MRRVLLLDDEINVLHALQRSLRQCFSGVDLRPEIFTDPEQALLRSAEVRFDVVVSDYRMPTMNGVEFLKTIKGVQPEAVRMILSASTEFETVLDAINRAEVFRYIAKPWVASELKQAFELAFARWDTTAEDRRLADELRAKAGEMTAQELEAKRLEADEPGITKVRWGPDGSVLLD
jgi:two-component system probable response regulator PhcQ